MSGTLVLTEYKLSLPLLWQWGNQKQTEKGTVAGLRVGIYPVLPLHWKCLVLVRPNRAIDLLSHCSIIVKRCHDQVNSYKGKHLIEDCSFRR